MTLTGFLSNVEMILSRIARIYMNYYGGLIRESYRAIAVPKLACLSCRKESLARGDRRQGNVRECWSVPSNRFTMLGCATIQPADACEWYHRQRRLVLGITERLAPVILFTSTTEAPDRHQKSYHRSRQRDDRNRQLQDQNSKLHRLITSFRKRRRCRVAGLTPLTKGYSTNTYPYKRTYVLTNQKKSTVCSLGISPSLSWKTEYGKAA